MGRGKLCGTVGHELSRVNDAGPGRDAEKKMKMKKKKKIIPQALPHKFFDTPRTSFLTGCNANVLTRRIVPYLLYDYSSRSLSALPSVFRRSHLAPCSSARIPICPSVGLLAHRVSSRRSVTATLNQRSKINYSSSIIHSLFRIISSLFLAYAYTHIRLGPLRTLIRDSANHAARFRPFLLLCPFIIA